MSLIACWEIQVGLFSRHYLLAAWKYVTLWSLQCLWDSPWWEHHCLCFRPASCPKLVPSNCCSVQLECCYPSLPRRQSCMGSIEVVCVDPHVWRLETESHLLYVTPDHSFHDFPSGLFALCSLLQFVGCRVETLDSRAQIRKAGNENCQNSS